jgi:poly(3-hydroxybutyrate) depolymerase
MEGAIMRKTIASILAAAMLCVPLAACGQPQTTSGEASGQAAATSANEADQPSKAGGASTKASSLGTVPNAIAEDKDAVVAACASKFTQETYVDASTGLSVTYNMLLPKDYDQSRSYPMVVFIADSSCTGNDASRSLTQGLGALVWATDEWQAANPTIVCVPTYPETILDDHSGYTTTEYVELTKRLIDSVASSYAVDASRIYGTGQSMGCMTTLILASEYPDLYAGCMLVDGQWDVSTLKGLEGQRFVYFAAEDDTSAFAGMSEVEAMFEADSVPFASAQWDGGWTPDERSSAATELFSQGKDANFISWKTGTIDAGSGSFGSQGGGLAGEGGAPEGGFGGPSGEGRSGGVGGAGAAGGAGGMGGASYHMASFNYAYRCIAVMEWLFQQA